MKSSDMHQNHSQSIRKPVKSLVLRVQLHNEEVFSRKNKIDKDAGNTVMQASRSRSASKRRSPSWKMFANARVPTSDQTFLVNSKKQRTNSKFKTIVEKENLRSSLKNNHLTSSAPHENKENSR